MKEAESSFTSRKFVMIARAFIAALFLSACVFGVRAQNERATEQTPDVRREREAGRRGDEGAAGLLRALNLSPEQHAQIAAIRRETEPQGRLLGARLRQARRALDEAIYAASPDERLVEERTREVAAAQAAVMRLRAFTELKIRRVLSPEQLDAFRRLQRQTPAARRRNRMERRRQERQQQQLLAAPDDPHAAQPSSVPRDGRRRRAPSRDGRPPRR